MPQPSAPSRPYANQSPEQRRAARRARLVEAALDAFGEEGFRAVGIERLCTSAGISTRNFYEEFDSREELLIALHDDVNQRALEAVVATLAEVDPDDVRARVRAAVEAYLRVMTSDRRYARVAIIESVGVNPAVEAHRRAAIGRFVDLIALEADRLADGGLAERRDYSLTAVAIAGALNGLVNTWTEGPEWDERLPRIVDEAERFIVRSILSR